MAVNWRNSKECRIWRALIIRQQKVCIICGSKKTREVHHIKDGSNHPEHRFDLDNGIVLCKKHHTLFHTKYKKSFRQKTTEEDWYDFMAIVNDIKSLNKEIIDGKDNSSSIL